MTYTKFSVNVNSPKPKDKRKTSVFFDITLPESSSAKRRKKHRHTGNTYASKRRFTRFLTAMFGAAFRLACFLTFCAVLCTALLFATGIVKVKDGTICFDKNPREIKEAISSVFNNTSFFGNNRDNTEALPSFNTISSYYMKMRDTNHNSADVDETDSISVSVQTDIPEVENKNSVTVDNAETAVENTMVTGQSFPLLSLDLSGNLNKAGNNTSDHKLPLVRINNETSYSVNVEQSLEKDFPIEPLVPFNDMENPKVLIVHTHGTEAYTSVDGAYYHKSEASPRSTDTQKNVVGLGKQLSDSLNAYGIPTLHCDIMHDEKSYLTSYKSAAQTIEKYLSEYPDIKYVIDLHRDSIVRSDNQKVKPVSEICGEKTAQIMFVVGTDGGGAKHDTWKTNIDTAIHLQQRIASDYPTLVRPINLRNSRFNQQYTPGSLILEVGSCGNTYTEAQRAIKLFAGSFFRAVTR